MKYTEAKDTVLQELQTVFANVKEEEVLALTAAICEAESVFVVGVGRVLLMLQAFVKRLNHLGIEATYVGAVDEPVLLLFYFRGYFEVTSYEQVCYLSAA